MFGEKPMTNVVLQPCYFYTNTPVACYMDNTAVVDREKLGVFGCSFLLLLREDASVPSHPVQTNRQSKAYYVE